MGTIGETVVNNESQAQIVEGGKKMKIDILSYCKVKTKFFLNDKRQLLADLEIMKYLYMANLPFTHVASDAFKELMHTQCLKSISKHLQHIQEANYQSYTKIFEAQF